VWKELDDANVELDVTEHGRERLEWFAEVMVTAIDRLNINGFGFLKCLPGSEMLHLSGPTQDE
jgi:hypothetical protein